MIKYLVCILLAVVSITLPAAAQTDEEESFRNELSYGINFNSNGGLIGGAFIKSSFFVSEKMYQFGGIEVVEVKHPKENRLYSNTGDFFIAGKQNYLFVVRPHYGRELVLFRKAAESGVQVNAVGAAGPSLGLLVPYYINFNYSGSSIGADDVRTEQYDPARHGRLEAVQGSAGLFHGISETKVNIGVHAKAGLSFEYGRYNESITGIEVGFLVEAYPKDLIMIPQAKNTQLFSSVYLNLYYGRRK